MNLLLAHNGSYPRIGDCPELQVLRRTLAALDRGEATAADCQQAEDEMVRRAITEQVEAGLEVVTDGQIRWHDPVSHLAARLTGTRINGLLRFFDTNFYFRQPILEQSPRREQPLLVEEFHRAQPILQEIAGNRHVVLKPVLTGPYTLGRLSLAAHPSLQGLSARVLAYAEALAAEVVALAAAGAEQIQVDEPAILFHPEDWPLFAESWQVLAAAARATGDGHPPVALLLYVYFRDCGPLYEKLVGLPTDGVGLDFTYGPTVIERIASIGSPVPLAFGLVDGRNVKLEDPAAVARQLERLLPRVQAQQSWLGPSCGLEYLPRDRAQAKLRLLGQIRALVLGHSPA